MPMALLCVTATAPYSPLGSHSYHRLQNIPLSLRHPHRLHSHLNPLPHVLLQLTTASSILFLGLSARPSPAFASAPIIADSQALIEHRSEGYHDVGEIVTKEESFQDKELNAKFESWKSKTYALTVPLRIVALRGSLPPPWLKGFMQSQGRRLKFRSEFRASLEEIISDLVTVFIKGYTGPNSAAAADIVSIGDSWLKLAIQQGIIEPIAGAEEQDWFKNLSDKWKAYLRRNSVGELDSEGEIWAAPYRWGSMVIAYKKKKFLQHQLPPVEDWSDLWRPELSGKISMVDSPREVVGMILKYMGASYNSMNIELQVHGGTKAVQHNLSVLQKQVRLFDSKHYLKAFAVDDVWVAVGWSSDVVPAAKRMPNVAVVVPKSGASLWADLWAIPAASKLETDQIGGRVRGPSPLIHQWIEYCLQDARALPFEQEVIPGASPSSLENPVFGKNLADNKKPRLDTNLVCGIPPPEILGKCEFLEPLSDAALSDYKWLIGSMLSPAPPMIQKLQHYLLSMVPKFSLKAR